MEAGRELDKLISESVFKEAFRPYASILTSMPAKSLPETPFYSTSIADAWLVVEKLLAIRGDRFQTVDVGHDRAVGWSCRMGDHGPSEPFAFSFGNTPAYAICLAALKAIGSETPSKP